MDLSFDIPAPQAGDLGASLRLWGTYYYAHPAPETDAGVPLRDTHDRVVGPKISPRDWCLGAMEGTIVVTRKDGTVATYNYAGRGATADASCAVYFPHYPPAQLPPLEHSRFEPARGPYGNGSPPYLLAPYRTIAVDPSHIAIGTVVHIAQAAGAALLLPDGSHAAHDGYFFAGDTGGAIRNNHIDIFVGISSTNPFPFATSDPSDTFEARVVTSRSIIDRLTRLHRGA